MATITPSLSMSESAPSKSEAQARRAGQARAVSGRRRRIDPTTCDRDYSAQEMEFLAAIEAYKLASGNSFPTWGEVLEVLVRLGYEKSA